MEGNLKHRLFAILLCVAMVISSVNLTNIFSSKLNAAVSLSQKDYTATVKNVGIASSSTNKTPNSFHTLFNEIGHYELNVIGASNVITFTSDAGIATLNSGISHVNICSEYEEAGCMTNIYGNSSGCQLTRKSSGNSIKKAYLVVKVAAGPYSSTASKNLASNTQYVKLLYSSNGTSISSGIKTNFQYIDYRNTEMGSATVTDATMIVDVTEFVKSKGYGYYYVCNIPNRYISDGDNTAGWQLVILEENSSLPLRSVNVEAGIANIGSSVYQGSVYKKTLSLTNGITTKSEGTVTGQILMSLCNNDFRSTPLETLKYTPDGSTYTDFNMTSGLRKKGYQYPGIYTINDTPLNTIETWKKGASTAAAGTQYYYNKSTGKHVTTTTNYKIEAGDLLLLDINTSSGNNISFNNSVSNVGFSFSNAGLLQCTLLGIVADVDPETIPFTIKYNANGGTNAPSDTYVETSSDISSTVPTRSGYIFRGWGKSSSWCTSRLAYTSSSGGGSANDGTSATISSSKTADEWRSYFGTSGNSGTLYAQWEPITYTYTIQFDANGGTGSVPSTITKTGSDSSVVMGDIGSTVPTRSGYVFRGWSASSSWSSKRIAYTTNHGGSAASDGTTATTTGNWSYATYCTNAGGSTSSRTLTLYAQWEIAYTHTLNYNANGGTGAPSSQSVTNTSSTYGMTVSSTIPTRIGYTFSKWNTNSSGTGTNYTAGSSVSVGANASVTLYAQWTPNTNTPYKVNHYLMNTDGSTYALKETESLTGTTATTLTLSNLKNTYEGFTYQGGKGTTAASATKPSSFDTTTTILADGTRVINLYYSRNQYTVTYIDVVDSQTGTQLGKSTGTAYYGTSVSGATKGTNTADNAYYKGYYYSSCTTATVGTSGATVYRIFKLRTIDVNGSVNWNDKSNAYDSRPNDGDVTIYLYRNGELLKSTSTGLVEKDNNSFSFTGLQKYNTATGETYTYTVSQSEVISQNTPEDKYTTTVDSTGFNFTNTLGNADFHVEGSITWVDYENKYGTRPSEATLNLYQNNKLFKTQVVDNNTTGYSFVNLPKYDDKLNSYTYMVEEVFTAKALTWDSTIKEWKEIDAYTISADGFDFTNTLVETDDPIIEVKPEHTNNLTIKLDFNENIDWVDVEKVSSEVVSFVTLKQMEMIMNEGTISYTSSYNGMEYKAIVDEVGVSINNIPSGKYEIIESNDNTFILEGIDLQTNNSMSVLNENGKWYLIIAETNQNQSGTIILNMNIDSFNGYDDSANVSNLYKIGDKTSSTQVMMLSMFSDEVTVPEYVEPITYTITYKGCDVVDDTKYSENSEAILKDCEIEGFLGWSEDSEAIEPQYMAGDTVILEKDLILYPVIETPESTEENSSEETTEEIESEEQEETTETESTLEEEISEVDESTETVETETEEEVVSEEEESSEIEETTESEEIEIESSETIEREESLEESSAFSE